jgi:hypothetical protein
MAMSATVPDSPSPWDRMPGESSKAYSAFVLYRDQGPRRTIDEASRLYHAGNQASNPDADRTPTGRKIRASGVVRGWVVRWKWQERAQAWDAEMDRRKQAAQVTVVQEMLERHANEAMMLQQKAIERLRELEPTDLNSRDTLSYLVEAIKIERLARGINEKMEHEHAGKDGEPLTPYHVVEVHHHDHSQHNGEQSAEPSEATAPGRDLPGPEQG